MIFAVAPFAGAWIEIGMLAIINASDESLPSRERGLKWKLQVVRVLALIVAPFAGAWIEIIM